MSTKAAKTWRAFADRFWAKVDRVHGTVPTNDPSLGPCWPWTGALSEKRGGGKYGAAWLPGGKIVGAHRVALALSTTGVIPDGKDCCHRCDNPICCNPDHLFWDTHKANMADYARKYGGVFRKKISRPKYHDLLDLIEGVA